MGKNSAIKRVLVERNSGAFTTPFVISAPEAARSIIGHLETVKQATGPCRGIAMKYWPKSGNFQARLERIYNLAKELQDDLSKIASEE